MIAGSSGPTAGWRRTRDAGPHLDLVLETDCVRTGPPVLVGRRGRAAALVAGSPRSLRANDWAYGPPHLGGGAPEPVPVVHSLRTRLTIEVLQTRSPPARHELTSECSEGNHDTSYNAHNAGSRAGR